MLIGEDETKELFKYLSKHGVRTLAGGCLPERQVDELVAQVPDNVLTGFQLKDILEAAKSRHEIKSRVYEALLFNKRFPKSLLHDFTKPDSPSEDPEEEVAKKKAQDFDLAKFLADVGAPECIVKLQKQDLLDAELFFRTEMGTLEGFLELKPEGKKMRVTKRIQEFKDKYDKGETIEYLDLGLLAEAPALKLQKSTTLGGKALATVPARKTSDPSLI